ncbi:MULTISPECIES: BC1872 family protein [Bacillaceae]|uniref:BC1872 family protein n=1 Tax=Bacillaceae TaxID=186817 RepID=UPI002FFF9D16
MMNKIEILARRILGWRLNRWDRWYDNGKEIFIPVSEFQPEDNLEHAMLLVERLKELGFVYKTNGKNEACFDDVCETGETLAHAITNAAFSIADNSSIDEGWL